MAGAINTKSPRIPNALAMPASTAAQLAPHSSAPLDIDGFDSNGGGGALGALGLGQSKALKGARLSDALMVPFKERMRILANTPGDVQS